MSSAKTIAKNVGFLFSTQIVDKVLSFLLVVIITRYLGSSGFGKYSFAFAFVSIIAMFVHFGVSAYIMREIAKDKSKAKELFDNAFTLRLVAMIGVFIISLIFAKFWPKTNEIMFAIILVMLYSLIDLFNSSTRILFNSYEKNEYGLYSTTIEKTVLLILSYIALSTGYGLDALLVIFTIAALITLLYNYIISYKKFVRVSLSFDLKLWKNLIKNSFPFWFTLLFHKIYYQADIIMITAMKDYIATGWYTAASTLVIALTFIPTIIITSTFPAMSRFHHKNLKEYLSLLYKKSFYYLLIIGIPISIGISLLAQRIILFIYKNQFIESSMALSILSWAVVFVFLNHIMGYLLNSINKQHLFTVSTGICALSNIAINFILIPKFSYIGASFATVATHIINFGILYYFTSKNGYFLNLLRLCYKPIIAGIAMGILIPYIKFLPIIYIVPISAIFYFAVFLSIGGIGKEEKLLIKSFLPEKTGKY